MFFEFHFPKNCFWKNWKFPKGLKLSSQSQPPPQVCKTCNTRVDKYSGYGGIGCECTYIAGLIAKCCKQCGNLQCSCANKK